jgi:hypothetical protein
MSTWGTELGWSRRQWILDQTKNHLEAKSESKTLIPTISSCTVRSGLARCASENPVSVKRNN